MATYNYIYGNGVQMENRLSKRTLYEKFSGICLPEEVYSILENTGTIPKDIGQVFNGTFGTSSQNKYQGAIISNICSSGVKMMFENWGIVEKYYSDHIAMLVLKDFIVFVAEPQISSAGVTEECPDVLPVAIPLSSVYINSDIGKEGQTFTLSFDFEFGEAKFKSYLFEASFGKIEPVNFSLHVNKNSLHDLKSEARMGEYNSYEVSLGLSRIEKEAYKNWDDRLKVISLLFDDISIIRKLGKYSY